MGTENWPFWHYGVLLLYGQNVGMNHLIGSKQLNVIKLANFLDFPSGEDGLVDKKIGIMSLTSWLKYDHSRVIKRKKNFSSTCHKHAIYVYSRIIICKIL